MLGLRTDTSARWLATVDRHLDEVLIDHAHCEKKAAGVALNLIFSYVERTDLVRALAEIVSEELEHFRQVLDLLERRGVRFRRLPPSNYGRQLHELARKLEPGRAVDRCLIAALIEARSCERFALLRDHLRDGGRDAELANFYGSLFESEARHYSTYVRFAEEFADSEVVRGRLAELAAAEAEIIARGDALPRMHS
ncbi:MAG: tRNA-(ms[2]io[6]A)-hydroxylase [Pirellulales bacterium]|nr:tRNA-(ms[2]io[6]A)-hydroxylase [Pirellulales bacterium]